MINFDITQYHIFIDGRRTIILVANNVGLSWHWVREKDKHIIPIVTLVLRLNRTSSLNDTASIASIMLGVCNGEWGRRKNNANEGVFWLRQRDKVRTGDEHQGV